MNIKKYVISAISLIFFTALCEHVSIDLDCTNLVPEPANLGLLKQEIIRYHDSGAWEQAIACVAQDAQKIVRSYVPVGDKKLAVVFDIDEVALSNWPNVLEMDFTYHHDHYKNWELSARSKAIQPIRRLYRFVKDNGFAIFFITNRREDQRQATVKNLKTAGFESWEGLFLKPMGRVGMRTYEIKAMWRSYIQNLGYTIVANFGDQESDLKGKPQALYNFKIPNPAYFIP